MKPIIKTYEVTQTVYFTWTVQATNETEAEALASQLGYDDCTFSGADPVNLKDIVEVTE